MPNVDEMLGIGAAPKSQAEELAARAIPGSAVTGGLAGILATAVLGPVGLAIGAGMGINAQRLKRNAIDRTAADIQASDLFASRISDQLNNSAEYAKTYGTEQDLSQLSDIAQSVIRYKELAQHHDPQIRSMALAQLAAQDSRMDAWKEDIESRTETIADRDFDMRRELAKEYRAQVTIEHDALEDTALSSQRLLNMLDKHGADSEIVQGLARDYVEFTLKEAEASGAAVGFNIGIASGSFNTGVTKLTAQEIHDMVSATESADRKIRGQRIAMIQQQAQEDGFAINLKDGKLNVEDTNTALQDFKIDVPAIPPEAKSAIQQFLNPEASAPGGPVEDPYTAGAKSILDIATSAGKAVVDFVRRPTN